MDIYSIIIIILITGGTTVGMYIGIRRLFLIAQIKKCGRLITLTPLIMALIASRTQERRIWFSPATGLPPPPSYQQQQTNLPPPVYTTQTVSISVHTNSMEELPPPYSG